MIRHLPTLTTARLVLRPFRLEDALEVQRLAGAREVYETTLNIPHPYEDGVAETWIATHASGFFAGRSVALAVTAEERLVGAVTLMLSKPNRRGELGYWMGVPFWGNGYCTEAVKALIAYGFDELDLHRITGRHMAVNPASGRVMVKAGMKREGELVDDLRKDGVFHTLIVYGLIRP